MRRSSRASLARPVIAVGALGALVAGSVAGCSSSGGGPESQLAAAAQSHATTAGEVMTRGLGPVPARSAAGLVVGRTPSVTIEALRADGTTWKGAVTLAITVDEGGGTLSGGTYRGCFSYEFRHRLDDATPHRLASCPSTSPLSLPPPSTAPGVSPATVAAVRRALAKLSAARRRDAGAVRQAVRAALGPGYTVAAQRDSGRVDVHVDSGDQCLSATLAADGDIDVGAPAHGTSCRGG